MKRLDILVALAAWLPSAPSLAAACDASAFSIQSCFPSLSAPVLAWPGNIGLPKVIAWASTTGDSGVTWGTSASVTNGQAYLTYNGTEMVRNVPTSKGMAFAINGTIVAELASQGTSQLQLASPNFFVTTTSTLDLDTSTNGSQFTDITEGTNVIRLFGTAFATAASQNTALYLTNAADAATVVAHFFRNSGSLTATSKALASFQNGSQDEFLIRPTSGIALFNTVSVAAGDFGIGKTGAGTAMEFNVPTGDTFLWTINQGSEVQLSGVVADPTGFIGQINAAHYGGATAAPSAPTAGTGCATSSAPGSAGNDANPQLGVTCGGVGATSATIISATWATAYTGTNHCNWTCANAATCALAVGTIPFDSSTTAGPAILSNTTGLPAGTYLWRGVCWQQ